MIKYKILFDLLLHCEIAFVDCIFPAS